MNKRVEELLKRVGKFQRRAVCLLIGHSRNIYLQLFIARKTSQVQFSAYCARCARRIDHRIKRAKVDYSYHPNVKKGKAQ